LDILLKPFVNIDIVHKKIYTVKQSFCDFCNILNSENIAGNIANEQYHKKIMFSGDIELTPGSVFCNSVQNNSPTI
jgi:hypothetical protein